MENIKKLILINKLSDLKLLNGSFILLDKFIKYVKIVFAHHYYYDLTFKFTYLLFRLINLDIY
jgi:hypothetical protein